MLHDDAGSGFCSSRPEGERRRMNGLSSSRPFRWRGRVWGGTFHFPAQPSSNCVGTAGAFAPAQPGLLPEVTARRFCAKFLTGRKAAEQYVKERMSKLSRANCACSVATKGRKARVGRFSCASPLKMRGGRRSGRARSCCAPGAPGLAQNLLEDPVPNANSAEFPRASNAATVKSRHSCSRRWCSVDPSRCLRSRESEEIRFPPRSPKSF